MSRAFAIVALIVCGCGDTCDQYYWHLFYDQFPGQYAYQVMPMFTTLTGFHVDDSGVGADVPNIIDRQADEAESCVADLLANGWIPGWANGCDGTRFSMPVCRSCFTIKVAADAFLSRDGTQELLPSPAPATGCADKGLCSDVKNCPCYWRAGIQDNRYIVIPPSGYLFKDAFVRQATGCNSVWVGELAACVHPTVPPLSGLVGT